MRHDDRELVRARGPLLLFSAVAWFLLVVAPGSASVFLHCPATKSWMSLSASFGMLLSMNPLAHLAEAWALMLIAMMAPMLVQPIRHIRLRSFTHRRARSIMLFVIAYAAIWMLAGVILIALAQGFRALVPDSPVLLALTSFVAIVWQFSPVKQRSLNRGHAHPVLRAFGWTADIDALQFGVTHGTWCVASCWLLMLLMLLVPYSHVAVMGAVTLLVWAERLENPAEPRWDLRGPRKVVRLAIAQTRLQFERS